LLPVQADTSFRTVTIEASGAAPDRPWRIRAVPSHLVTP
jgi:hypothetical protein